MMRYYLVSVSFIYIARLKSLWPTKVLYGIKQPTTIRNNKSKTVKLKKGIIRWRPHSRLNIGLDS